MLTLVVQTFPGANETVFRHYPYYQASGADRIIGLVTTDGACRWPTEDVAAVGPDQYIGGDHLPRRLLNSLEVGIASGASEIVVIEYDVVFFKPLPPLNDAGIAMVPTGGPMAGYNCSRFFHCPWYMKTETAQRVVEAGYSLIESGDIEHGMPDCFIGRLADVTRLPTLENIFSRYSQNTISTQEHLEQAREAFRAGVHAMHGVKTKAQLDFIVS